MSCDLAVLEVRRDPVSPLGWDVLRIESWADERKRLGLVGSLKELHASLFRRAVRLLAVARVAGCHDVIPDGAATEVPWEHVVVVQLAHALGTSAVAAPEVVAREDVDPRELDRTLHSRDRLAKANDRRHLHDFASGRARVDDLIGRGDDFYLVGIDHRDRMLPCDYLMRCKSRVEK